MIELGDIIDLIWVDGDKPIRIITEDNEVLEYGENYIPSDVLGSAVVEISIYDSCVEIELEE